MKVRVILPLVFVLWAATSLAWWRGQQEIEDVRRQLTAEKALSQKERRRADDNERECLDAAEKLLACAEMLKRSALERQRLESGIDSMTKDMRDLSKIIDHAAKQK